MTAGRRCETGIVAALVCCWIAYAAAANTPAEKPAAAAVKIAVFPFELEDFSAANRNADTPHLIQATEEAKQQLMQSGRYTVVDTAAADMTAANGKALRDCGGCEAGIARKLGADQALLGVVSRISMTEYVIKLQVTDAASGAIVSNFTSELRMGANYSWSRGVRSLVQNRMLASASR
jgi:hypothetical protein